MNRNYWKKLQSDTLIGETHILSLSLCCCAYVKWCPTFSLFPSHECHSAMYMYDVCKLLTNNLLKRSNLAWPLFVTFHSYSEVDVTGITEFSVNSSTHQVGNDSVILQNDAEKYLQSEESASKDYSSDEDDSNDRYKSKFYFF